MPFLRAGLSGASRSLSVQRAGFTTGCRPDRTRRRPDGLTQDSPRVYDSTFLSGFLTESLRAGSSR